MQIRNKLRAILAAALVLVPLGAFGQGSSINTYSPYSFYGLGDIAVQGSSAIRSMGGAGVATRDFTAINYLNPASYSAVPQRSALFSVGLEGQNHYLKDANGSTGYNSFSLREIAFQIPLARGIGFAFSMMPYSSVGYNIESTEVIADIGYINKTYTGQGGLDQFKFGLGWELWKNRLSIGAELAYYHGNIQRSYNLVPHPVTGSGTYLGLYGIQTDKINTFFGNFGLQASLIDKGNNILRLGAVYRMGGTLRGTVTDHIPHSGNPVEDPANAVRYEDNPLRMKMPHSVVVGLTYARPVYILALDYTYAAWDGANENWVSRDGISFRNTHSLGLGGEITPNAGNVRSYFSRCSYRLGARFSQYYMLFDGRSFDEKAITLGVGFPLDQRNRNSIDVGLEIGTRGTTSHGLVKENYFKLSIGLKLFGDDYWFTKYKYN